MTKILIGTKNPFKREKLAAIVRGQYEPTFADALPEVEEVGSTALEIAEQKARVYSLLSGGLAIATDGGAVIPALPGWDPLRTRRFATTDAERIEKLLKYMQDKTDRVIEWHEAIAVADRGQIVFSTTARAMDGVIDTAFDPANYREGIWLCSITSFPQFGNKNYFKLTDQEREKTEDSWTTLEEAFKKFIAAKVSG